MMNGLQQEFFDCLLLIAKYQKVKNALRAQKTKRYKELKTKKEERGNEIGIEKEGERERKSVCRIELEKYLKTKR